MTDTQIVEMYWNRNEQAISVTAEKYGTYCYSVAYGILHNEEDSEESVNDTYMSAWNSMPPHKPGILKTFLGKITRRLSIDKWRRKNAEKRGGEIAEVLDELSECISPSGDPIAEMEKVMLDKTINNFVRELKDTEQRVFLCRYWYAKSVKEIAKLFGFSESKVKVMLMRTRNKLKTRLNVMTKFDLFDSIGNVDDELIEKAIEPKKSSKKAFLAITSVAACAVFACAAVLIVQNMNKSNNVVVDPGASSAVGTSSVKPVKEDSSDNGAVGGSSSETPVLEDSVEKALEEMPFEIYYAANGKMKQKTIVTNASPENLFNIWKKENQIGDEVRFISAKLSDNGTTELSEYSGVEVATHKVGDHTVYTLTITKNLEQYYDSIEEELLLDSLEKTMTGMCDPKPDEYQLILSDNADNGKSESKSSIPDNEQGNDDVVNSDAYTVTETSPVNPGTEGSDEYVTQEYIPDKTETDQASSNYAEESESNYVAPEDIQYNDQGEALE